MIDSYLYAGEQRMNGFRKMQERLKEEGWYVGWNHYCCQSCAWMDVPDKFEDGKEVDLSKVLFNHSQDCEFYIEDEEECPDCLGEGYDENEEDCMTCEGRGSVLPDSMPEGLIYDDGFICYPPEMQSESMFCFDGSKEGVENLKSILPIIEECGCSYNWSGTGDQRIEISWEVE